MESEQLEGTDNVTELGTTDESDQEVEISIENKSRFIVIKEEFIDLIKYNKLH